MHKSSNPRPPDESTTHLLTRLSSDGIPSTPDHLSDFNDDVDTYYHKSRRRRKNGRLRRFLYRLTYTPLGLSTHRKTKSRRLRLFACVVNSLLITLVLGIVVSLLEGIFRPSYSNPPKHYKELEEKIKASDLPGRGNPRGKKIFIASNIIQHEMIRGPWGASVLKLIDLLGPENTFVSIYENDSGPETILALSWLRDQMKGPHSISFGDHLPLSEFPTVVVPDGHARVKRLTYLTEVRNRLLRPLHDLPKSEGKTAKSKDDTNTASPFAAINYTSTRFDRILFINDIYFKPEDALHLLFNTNQNPETGIAEYQTACSLDFVRGGTLYDSFVIRDTDGQEISWFLYPWFTKAGSATSRNDMLAQKDAVRVRSCWSGMAAFEATPFMRKAVIDINPKPSSPDPSKTTNLALTQDYKPLRFRHESDLFWESSECCLVNADILARYPGIDTQIFLNPYVRVAYDHGTWVWQPWLQRFERGFVLMEYVADKIGLGWETNARRNEIVGRPSSVRKWVYDNDDLNGEKFRNTTQDAANGLRFPLSKEQLKGSWKMVEQVAEPGGFCGQRRLFVMLQDFEKANRGNTGKNWVKIPVPS